MVFSNFPISPAKNHHALGYGNTTKAAHRNQQKRTYTTCSKGMFLLIAACHLSQVSVAQGTMKPIEAGVPQGSILGPYLYLLFTSDISTHPQILTATFAGTSH